MEVDPDCGPSARRRKSLESEVQVGQHFYNFKCLQNKGREGGLSARQAKRGKHQSSLQRHVEMTKASYF